jgi:hypothetical protein
MRWTIELDGNPYDLPNNWQAVEFTIKFDRELRIYTGEFSTDFEFTGTAFDYINTAAASLCTEIDVEIFWGCDFSETQSSVFEGKIFIVDCLFDVDYCTVKAPVQDASWNSIINSNKAIKAHLDVARSKNDVAITTPTNKTIDFFDAQTAGPTVYPGAVSLIEAYLVDEAFEFMVDFVSDGGLQYSSSLFGAGGDMEGLCLTTGAAINAGSSATGNAPYISFVDLFTEMDKLFNLAMRFDLSTAPPTLIVDKTDDIKNPDALSAVYLEEVKGAKQSYATDLMYSVVNTGSETTQDDSGGTYAFPDIVYLSHKNEEFHVLGDCNIDNTLDLVNQWIIDSNVIEDIVTNKVGGTPITDYDSNVIIVETELPATNNCLPDGTFSTHSVYNMGLSTRDLFFNYWGGRIPNDLAQYLGNGNDEFRAQRTATLAVVGPNANVSENPFSTPDDFTPPNTDPNNRFNTANMRYTPVTAGYYTMFSELRIRNFTSTSTPVLRITMNFARYNSLVFLQETKSVVVEIDDNATLNIQPPGFYMDANDFIVADINLLDVSPGPKTISCDLTTDSWIACIETENGGGAYQTYDPEEYPVVLYEFQYPIPVGTFETWLANPQSQFRFNTGNGANDIECFIEELKYTPQKQLCDLTVITQNNKKP